MNYNPYDLINLIINGKPITGRPFEFNSTLHDHKRMTNALGALVKPTKVSTMCPDCGQGLYVDVFLDTPPFAPVVVTCSYCQPAPAPFQDPFTNPVQSGRVRSIELDQLIHDPKVALESVDGVVADRFKNAFVQASDLTSSSVPALNKPKSPKSKKKPKKSQERTVETLPAVAPEERSVPLPPTDIGFGEEQDFDDSELVD